MACQCTWCGASRGETDAIADEMTHALGDDRDEIPYVLTEKAETHLRELEWMFDELPIYFRTIGDDDDGEHNDTCEKQ